MGQINAIFFIFHNNILCFMGSQQLRILIVCHKAQSSLNNHFKQTLYLITDVNSFHHFQYIH